MATQSPFSRVEEILTQLKPNIEPPQWAVDEAQRRIVLLLNHILLQEPEATRRLMRQKGSTVRVTWQKFDLLLVITPAGLFDRADPLVRPDLTLAITEASAVSLVQALARGDKPSVRIEGDVQLAAEVNWLVDHVRWDVEEDLSKIVGDGPAHFAAQAASRAVQALKEFLDGQKK